MGECVTLQLSTAINKQNPNTDMDIGMSSVLSRSVPCATIRLTQAHSTAHTALFKVRQVGILGTPTDRASDMASMATLVCNCRVLPY